MPVMICEVINRELVIVSEVYCVAVWYWYCVSLLWQLPSHTPF